MDSKFDRQFTLCLTSTMEDEKRRTESSVDLPIHFSTAGVLIRPYRVRSWVRCGGMARIATKAYHRRRRVQHEFLRAQILSPDFDLNKLSWIQLSVIFEIATTYSDLVGQIWGERKRQIWRNLLAQRGVNLTIPSSREQ